MLCLSGFELYSRWVPLKGSLKIHSKFMAKDNKRDEKSTEKIKIIYFL